MSTADTARPRVARSTAVDGRPSTTAAPDDVDIALRSGATLRLRPLRSGEEPALRRFLERLGPDDRTLRFFSAAASMRRVAHEAATAASADRRDLVALAADGETVLAHGCAVADPYERGAAEVAFVVAPELRGEGVATAMLSLLAAWARGAGIERLTAVVLPENHAMIEVFRESGLEPVVRAVAGELHVSMPSELGPTGRERFDARAAEAAAAGVAHVLRPRSVAVVGASDRAGSVGGAVVRNLLTAGFAGRLQPVNRSGGEVAGIAAVPSVGALQEPVELVVVAVPAVEVAGVARDCAAHGVRALIVLSDGFAEAGEAGQARQRELLDVCRRAGMRLVGPNCLGALNTDRSVRLDATFAPTVPPAGNVAFLSQSGALGIAVIDAARELGIGLSSFVSVGDKADLSGNDFLAFWERDEATDVVLLYLESFGNPRKFARVARRVARKKPIVAVKGGRSEAGATAAGSHTGALVTANDATVQALLRQAGVIPTDTLGELFDVAALLSRQQPPRGRRVAIVTNGGGLGILCADACAASGLEVAPLSTALRDRLAADAQPGAAVNNPVDLLAAATPAQIERTLARLGASGEVDAAITLYVPPMLSDPPAVAEAIARGAHAAGIPVASVLAMADPPRASLGALPLYRFPEEAARALARAAAYGEWRAEPDDPAPCLDAARDAAAALIARALERGPGWLHPAEVAALLDAYGIARPAQHVVRSASAAARAARALGGPVALKAIADGVVHRSDVGAVVVGLRSQSAVGREAAAMRARLERAGHPTHGFVVQAMAPGGVELLLGVVSDPAIGPVVACAAGGTTAELESDAALRLTPLGPREARRMVRELRRFPVLDGFRGTPRCDVAAAEAMLLRLAALADAHPEVAELDCNPVVVSPRGAVAVDARVRVRPAVPPAPEAALRR
jgi:acyl-CoA synthetase (NDP forming)/RimJ/RimL family protein N-acetyltransferase